MIRLELWIRVGLSFQLTWWHWLHLALRVHHHHHYHVGVDVLHMAAIHLLLLWLLVVSHKGHHVMQVIWIHVLLVLLLLLVHVLLVRIVTWLSAALERCLWC